MIEHRAPAEVKNFGSIYGLSGECAWGRTTETQEQMGHLARDWAGKMLANCRNREPSSLLIFGKTNQGAKKAAVRAVSARD